jgi:hypothetical protein
VLESELRITPEPSQLSWTRDVFGNHVATARFSERASELRFESTIHLDHAPAGFPEADIEDFARTYRSPTGRKIGPASRASSRRCLCTQGLAPEFVHAAIRRKVPTRDSRTAKK